MKQLLEFSSARLQRAVTLKKKIEKLQVQLARLLGDDTAPAANQAAPKRRKMSAAGRARIAAAAKARWAKFRAAKKK